MSEYLDAPARDADVAEWRRYAGELRQRLGEAARQPGRDELARASALIDRLRLNCDSLRASRDRLLHEKKRDARNLNTVEALLLRGDVPGAADLLARRRAFIEAAQAEKQDQFAHRFANDDRLGIHLADRRSVRRQDAVE